MIAFSSLATSQLQSMYDDLGIAQNTKIGWVDEAKKRIHNAVISGSRTVTLIAGLTVLCIVEESDTALIVKSIVRA